MNTKTSIYLVFVLACCVSCRTTSQKASIETLAKQQLGEGVRITWNASHTYALCKSAQTSNPRFKYAVYNSKGEKVKQGGLNGKINWYQDKVLVVKKYPPITGGNPLSKDDGISYIYLEPKKQ